MKSLAIVIMDSKFNASLMHYVLVLMLLENHWSLVRPTPIGHNCSFKNIVPLTNLLVHDTKETLQIYEKCNSSNPQIPHKISVEIPNATVAGFNMTEKLQDIYAKNEIFSLHLSQVEIYQQGFSKTHQILTYLSMVKIRLQHLLNKTKCLIKTMDPSAALPAPPAALNLPYIFSYEKKVYGCAVLVRLRDWGQNVHKVQRSMLNVEE